MTKMENNEVLDFMENEKCVKVERFRHLNKLARKGQIVFAGSSLMEQFPINELLQNNGMNTVIYNRGIGGYTAPEMLKSINEQILDLEPSVIFINIGTNDISNPVCSVEQLMGTYKQILDLIKEKLPETKVYLMAYYPVNDLDVPNDWPGAAQMMASRKEKLPQANAAAEKLAASMGYEFIDVNDGLTDENGLLKKEYTIDGIHMYADGYQQVFLNMKKYLL